jgi:hypothetical protein
VLTFDEAIDTEFVQLRVTDAAGRRVDRGAAHHPGGREELVAVRLRPGLEGRVVASYRVISEDGHPVGKQTSFRVRPRAPAPEDQEEAQPPAAGGGAKAPPAAMPDPTGAHLESLTGPVTDAAFAVARGFGYLALAVAVGDLAFMLVVCLPRLRRVAGGGEDPGRTAAILRRAVAAEVALVLVVLGVTSVLVATQPASG